MTDPCDHLGRKTWPVTDGEVMAGWLTRCPCGATLEATAEKGRCAACGRVLTVEAA